MTRSIMIGRHRLVANCDSGNDVAAQSMLESLAQHHAAGPHLHPGSRIDFGWAVLQIESDGDDWVVCEPDLETEPMVWRPSVDTTLTVLKDQAACANMLGVPPRATRGDQLVWLVPDAEGATETYLHRGTPASAEDSGWYIGAESADGETAGAKARQIRAGRLLELAPEWLPVLALPPGYLVRFRNRQLAEVYNQDDECIFPKGDDRAC